jgi:excisionase family DNA binding protein
MSKSEKEDAGKTPATQLISVNEAARRLGVCRKTVENLLLRKELKKVPVLRRVMIQESEIESYVRRKLR